MRDLSPNRRAALLAQVEQAIELPMLVLAIVLLVIFLVVELVPVAPATLVVLEGISWLIWAAFAVELVVKTYLARNRRRYLLTHWVDVLLVLVPFFRPIRSLRIIIVASRSWTHARLIFRRRTFSLIGVTSLFTIAVASTLMYIVERDANGAITSYPDALWWAISTITTVGYGDVYPTTPAGRGIAVFLMVAGISLFGLLTARVAAFFVEEDEHDNLDPNLDEIVARLKSIEARLADLQSERDRSL